MPIRGENLPYFYIPPTIYKDILWAEVSEDGKTLFIFPSMVICLPVNYSYVMKILQGQHNLPREKSHNTLRELFFSVKTSSRGWKLKLK